MLVAGWLPGITHDVTPRPATYRGEKIVAIQVFQPEQGQIFLDESRQALSGGTIYSVSAFVTRYDTGRALTDEWQKVLAAYGVAAFHGRELRSPRPPAPYDAWSQEKRDTFVLRLSQVAASHMIVGLG